MEQRLKQHPLGFYEIINKPSQKELQEYYAKKYYQEGKGSYELQYSDEELMYFQAKLEQRYHMLKRHLPDLERTPAILDVGCGEGYSLAFFQDLGWDIKGLDYSSAGVSSKNPACIDALTTGDVFNLLNSEVKNKVKYDVVWCQNVLEHVIDPVALLHSICELVEVGGCAVITVPNDFSVTQNGALALEHIDHEFWVLPPDHLSYFDYNSFLNVVHSVGWESLDVLADFPIDWFLYHEGSNFVNDRNKGKATHMARVQLENKINTKNIDDVVNFWSAAARLGVGRNLTMVIKAKG